MGLLISALEIQAARARSVKANSRASKRSGCCGGVKARFRSR